MAASTFCLSSAMNSSPIQSQPNDILSSIGIEASSLPSDPFGCGMSWLVMPRGSQLASVNIQRLAALRYLGSPVNRQASAVRATWALPRLPGV